jgi:predicted Zn-dependent protease
MAAVEQNANPVPPSPPVQESESLLVATSSPEAVSIEAEGAFLQPDTALLDLPAREVTERERLQAEKISRCSEIAQKVAKLEESVQREDRAGAERLMSELTDLKGPDNTYILKLKAFMLVQKGEYEAAAPILARVLKKDQNDLEAGINMAILEANTDQLQAARSRLAHLTKIYPSNSLVPAILEKLE